MDLEQLYQQHSKMLNGIMDTRVDLEPHPVKLETMEQLLNRAAGVLASALTHKYCKLNKKQKLAYDLRGCITIDDINHGDSISPCDFSFNSTIQTIPYRLAQQRTAFIHECIHCDTKNEDHGVGIYDIVCDNCSRLAMEKTFLENEDYKHETIIWMDEK